MPTFDIVSQVDMQEVRNAVDQAQREVAQRFDFRNTDSKIELSDDVITLESATDDRLAALMLVIEEKFVKRQVSLKSLDRGNVEEASGGRARQKITLVSGIASDKAKQINRFLKDNAPKGVASQTQGEQLRVNAKKRDDLQSVITLLKEEDFGIPLQFENFRD